MEKLNIAFTILALISFIAFWGFIISGHPESETSNSKVVISGGIFAVSLVGLMLTAKKQS